MGRNERDAKDGRDKLVSRPETPGRDGRPVDRRWTSVGPGNSSNTTHRTPVPSRHSTRSTSPPRGLSPRHMTTDCLASDHCSVFPVPPGPVGPPSCAPVPGRNGPQGSTLESRGLYVPVFPTGSQVPHPSSHNRSPRPHLRLTPGPSSRGEVPSFHGRSHLSLSFRRLSPVKDGKTQSRDSEVQGCARCLVSPTLRQRPHPYPDPPASP